MNQLGKLVILGTLVLLPAGVGPSQASQEEGWVSLFEQRDALRLDQRGRQREEQVGGRRQHYRWLRQSVDAL